VPTLYVILIFVFAIFIVAIVAAKWLKTYLKIGIRFLLVSFNVEIGKPADKPPDQPPAVNAPLDPPPLPAGPSPPLAIAPPDGAATSEGH
jgi:hypothetical protein